MGHNSADYIHVVTEALKLAFSDRHNHFGDPRFVKVPIEGLMSERYAQWRRSLISVEKAWSGMPPGGQSAHARGGRESLDARAAARRRRRDPETPRICA
jgi:gamma-glutamyltranspeptidase / glutathione hydrolase